MNSFSAPQAESWRIRLLIGLFTSLVSSGPAWAREIDRELFNPIVASILKVEVTTEKGGYSLGTALAVAPGKFVTSCHVTAQASSVTLIYQGLHYPVSQERSNTERDLCLLEAPKLLDVPPLSRSAAHGLRVGEDVAALGYTFGNGLSAQLGAIRGLHVLDHGVVIQSATYFNSGASGGGLFTADGKLVGVLTFRLKGAEAYYFSIPAEWIDVELARTDAFQPVAPLNGPPPFWSQPAEKLPFFMRAATLEARGNWIELLAVTKAWAESEPENAEPWTMRGQALIRIDERDAAAEAFEKAVSLDPKSGEAWFQLGQTQFQRGEAAEVERAMAKLTSLDSKLADELAIKCGIAR